MNEWTSYQLQDFIPFTADVYFRLLERMGENFWPLHLLTFAMGATTIVLALKHRTRIACLLPAPLWAFVAIAFFFQRYAELNWAGGYVGYAFIAQAVLLMLMALTGRGMDKAPRATNPPVIIGIAITLFGLILMPLLMPLMAPLSGGSWYQAEVFGIHADPTAVTTLGLVLIMLRGFALWIAVIIPALWLVVSGLTLQVLDSTGAAVLFAVLVIALVGLIWKSVRPER
ncbi:MFS transporter permease [Vreelandella neptunia]|uniref:MFS transporter permease n=1 Tax=Vreelandella neptunia TaxID=115551 RepID=A0ABS9S6V8_9GAMM|nr:MFS transporter permease [Halomonas neptunia]MCH4811858.1 MFS transporter permease [Halomonas neptunia]